MINSDNFVRHILGRWGIYRSNVIYSLHYEIDRNGDKHINYYIKNACIDFINKMFVIQAKETKYDTAEESEIFIEVPRSFIDIYNERIFDYMSNSDCVVACLQANRNKKKRNVSLSIIKRYERN